MDNLEPIVSPVPVGQVNPPVVDLPPVAVVPQLWSHGASSDGLGDGARLSFEDLLTAVSNTHGPQGALLFLQDVKDLSANQLAAKIPFANSPATRAYLLAKFRALTEVPVPAPVPQGPKGGFDVVKVGKLLMSGEGKFSPEDGGSKGFGYFVKRFRYEAAQQQLTEDQQRALLMYVVDTSTQNHLNQFGTQSVDALLDSLGKMCLGTTKQMTRRVRVLEWSTKIEPTKFLHDNFVDFSEFANFILTHKAFKEKADPKMTSILTMLYLSFHQHPWIDDLAEELLQADEIKYEVVTEKVRACLESVAQLTEGAPVEKPFVNFVNRDRGGAGASSGKQEHSKLKCWECGSTEHLRRDCPDEDSRFKGWIKWR